MGLRWPNLKSFDMKLSKFNSVLSIEGRHTLIYNSFTSKFVVIRNRLLDFGETSLDSILLETPDLYKQLCEAGIIIDDKTDEMSSLEKCIEEADNNENEFIMHINPTLDCNFNCWYCYENHLSGSKMDNDVIEATKKLIASILRKPEIEFFELGFFGGEPLYHFKSVAKNIIERTGNLCKELGKKLHIHFTSNGALVTPEMVEFLSQYNCGFQITLDGGKAKHDKTRYSKNSVGSYDVIVKNILLLASANIDVIVRVNYTSENIDSVTSIFDSFKDVPEECKTHIKFDFQRVWQDRPNEEDETELKITEIRRRFMHDNFVVLANYIPHDVRDSCYGDKINHILINYNGDVYGCTARDFNKDNRIGFLDESGVIQFDEEKVHKRNNSKYSKPVCKECRIAPLCGGGCKQRASESKTEACTMGYSEDDMDNIVLKIFEHSFL